MNCRKLDIAADFLPASLAGPHSCFAAFNKTTAKTTTKTV